MTVELTGFRPGSEDKEALAKVNFANMHLSCQRVSGSQFIGPIAWATVATVFSGKAKNLPAVSALEWSTLTDPGSDKSKQTQAANANPRIQNLLLSHGAGKLSVNVTTTPKTSALDKVLTVVVNTSKVLFPLFGFPGISTLALGAFYDFYGKAEAATNKDFLITTTQQDVVVAKQGLNVAGLDVNPLRLLAGNYILVPEIHQADFEKAMANLTTVNGLLAETSSTGALADRVKNAIPGISYLAVGIKVQSASEVPATVGVTDSVLEDNSASATDSGTSTGSKTGTVKPKKP